MLTLLVTLAAAATPTTPVPRHPLPYAVEYRGNGDLLVTDGRGDAIPTVDVIRFTEGPDAALRYQAHRSARKAGAVLMWVGSGALFTASAIGGMAADSNLGTAGIATSVGILGGGFALLYSPKEERLDHWTSVADVRTALPRLSPTPTSAPAPTVPLVVAPWSPSEDGPTRNGSPISIVEVGQTLGDTDTLAAYDRWRTSRKRTLGGLIAGGALVTVGGIALSSSSSDPEVQRSATATGLVGAGALAAGVAVAALPNPKKHAAAWFTPDQLDEAVRLHNEGRAPTGAADLPAEPSRPPLFTVAPTIGLGFAGLHGTF